MENKIYINKKAITSENIFNTTDEIMEWIQKRNQEVTVNIKQIPFSEMDS